MKTERSEKFGGILQGIIAPQILTYTKEFGPEFGVVSITRIQVSKDGKIAWIYLHAQSDELKLPKFLTALVPEIRHTIADHMSLYAVPEIRFRIEDDTNTFIDTFTAAMQELHIKETDE